MTEHERRELEWTWTGSGPVRPLKRGDSGPKVKQVQEWLTLHGFGTAIDGDFGPATEAAVKSWQEAQENNEAHGPGPWTHGEVNAAMWHTLVQDLVRATTMPRFPSHVVAALHLKLRPREVGGPNSGPWVRLYMDGHEGKDWPWCAGFATYVLRQALGHDKWRTFSCDELALKAKKRGLFLRTADPMWRQSAKAVTAGSLFLVRSVDDLNDWTHCGIVTAVGAEHFETVEGNTNQGGSREGTEVCKRVRAFGPRVDFVLMGDET